MSVTLCKPKPAEIGANPGLANAKATLRFVQIRPAGNFPRLSPQEEPPRRAASDLHPHTFGISDIFGSLPHPLPLGAVLRTVSEGGGYAIGLPRCPPPTHTQVGSSSLQHEVIDGVQLVQQRNRLEGWEAPCTAAVHMHECGRGCWLDLTTWGGVGGTTCTGAVFRAGPADL